MTRKRKTEQRKQRKLKELDKVQEEKKTELKALEGGFGKNHSTGLFRKTTLDD